MPASGQLKKWIGLSAQASAAEIYNSQSGFAADPGAGGNQNFKPSPTRPELMLT